MTHVHYHQIDRIVKANMLYRFKNEVEDCDNKTRIEQLNQIIENIESQKDQKQIQPKP